MGIGGAFVGLSVWVMNEKLCDEGSFFQLLPGHLMWHLAMPYGTMNMLIIIVFLQAPHLKKRPRFADDHPNRFLRWYFWIMPAFKFHSVEDLVAEHNQHKVFTELPATVGCLARADQKDEEDFHSSVTELEEDTARVMRQLFHASGSACSLSNLGEVEGKAEEEAEALINRMEGMLGDDNIKKLTERATNCMTAIRSTAGAAGTSMGATASYNAAHAELQGRSTRAIETLKDAERYAHHTRCHLSKHVSPHFMSTIKSKWHKGNSHSKPDISKSDNTEVEFAI